MKNNHSKMIKGYFILIMSMCLFNGHVISQILTIDSVLVKIESNHPELQMYEAQIKAMDSYAKGAKAWDAPQFSTGLYMTPYNVSLWKADPSTMGSQGMGSLMFTAQQMIPNPKKLNANQSLMLGMSGAEKENRTAIRNQFFAQAKTAYNEWLILKKKLVVANSTEDLMKFMISTAENRYTYNKEKLNTIYKTKASLYELNNMQIMLKNDIQQKRILLNALMNRDKNLEYDIDTIYAIKNYENNLIDTAQLVSHRSDIRSIEQSIRIAKLKQTYENSKRLPDFGIRYDHANTFGSQPNQFSLMGMITVPIAPWSSKMYQSNVAGLNFEINSLQKKKESILNESSGMLQSLKLEISNKKQQLTMYEKNIIPALNNNYQTSLLAYQQNTEELFMVLDALQTLKMAQLEHLNQLGDLLKLQVEFEKQMEN